MSQQKKTTSNFSKIVMPSFDFGKNQNNKRENNQLDLDDICFDSDEWSDDFDIPKKKSSRSDLCSLIKACKPEKSSDLSVSRQKQTEISNWLIYRARSASILVISGPSGCGKTHAVKVLAKEQNLDVVEWTTPLDPVIDADFPIMRQGEKFEEFFIRATRYHSVLGRPSKKILLVKDIPNVYIENNNQFFPLLQKYKEMGKESVVFVVTETPNSRIMQNLFPDNIRDLHKIDVIKYYVDLLLENHYDFVNATTPTAMKNMCKRVSVILNSKGCDYINVSQKAIDQVLANNVGDVRSALLNLIFCSLKVPDGKSKHCESREAALGIFHGVGRVINPKRITEGHTWKFIHNPDDIAVYFRSQAKTFSYFLHENYLNTMETIEQVSMAADILSIADTLNNEWRDPTLGLVTLSICIRGVMVANEKPVPGWNPVRKPRNLDQDIKRNWQSAELRFYGKIIETKSKSTNAVAETEDDMIIIE